MLDKFDIMFNKMSKLYELCSEEQKAQIDPLFNLIKSFRAQGMKPVWSEKMDQVASTIDALYNKLVAN